MVHVSCFLFLRAKARPGQLYTVQRDCSESQLLQSLWTTRVLVGARANLPLLVLTLSFAKMSAELPLTDTTVVKAQAALSYLLSFQEGQQGQDGNFLP